MKLFMRYFPTFSKNKLIQSFCVVFVLILLVRCNQENSETIIYKSNDTKKETSSFEKLEFKTDNPEEWEVSNNRIACLVSAENRKIQLQTTKLENQKGGLEIKVRLGFFNDKVSSLNKNWAGIHISSVSDPNVNVNTQKKGLSIGLCTNGALFIGTPSPNQNNDSIISTLKNGVDLKVSILNNSKDYVIYFSVSDIKTKKILSRISKKGITKEQIAGSLALISNFENREFNSNDNPKSVWFQDLEIKGSKVEELIK